MQKQKEQNYYFIYGVSFTPVQEIIVFGTALNLLSVKENKGKVNIVPVLYCYWKHSARMKRCTKLMFSKYCVEMIVI